MCLSITRYWITGKAPLYYFDMTDNWWGTTEKDSIQAWIEDGLDIPDYPFFVVWDPFRDEAVSQKKTSLGGLKPRFR
ncbi:MAG: hypothetical protein GY780_01485 [bacterium]|nr:hypothetical protein [bacterium]